MSEIRRKCQMRARTDGYANEILALLDEVVETIGRGLVEGGE